MCSDYSYIKRKLLRTEKLKIHVGYSYRYFSAWGENPRKYKFKSILYVQNIDTSPIYQVKIFKYLKKEIGEPLFEKVSLKPDDKIEQEEDKIVECGDGHNHIEEAKKILPEIFVNPTILIRYENKNGKQFKCTWQKNIIK